MPYEICADCGSAGLLYVCLECTDAAARCAECNDSHSMVHAEDPRAAHCLLYDGPAKHQVFRRCSECSGAPTSANGPVCDHAGGER
jgi:hypothetical protein